MQCPEEVVYKLHPAVKLLAVMSITAAIFFIDKILICVCLALFLFLFRLAAGLFLNLSFSFKVKHIVNFLLLAAFIILIQSFFGRGTVFGIAITCRVISLLLVFPILTATTPPHKLAAALNSLGFPYKIAFIITTAFNQVNHFQEEARIITDVQRLRACCAFDMSYWKPADQFMRIKAYAGICFPLVLGAMRKAQISSVAMDSRAFGVNKKRTWLEKPQFKRADYFFILGCLIFVILLLVLNSYVDYQF